MKTIYIAELNLYGGWARSSNAPDEYKTREAARRRVNSHGPQSATYRIVEIKRAKEIRTVVGKPFKPKR